MMLIYVHIYTILGYIHYSRISIYQFIVSKDVVPPFSLFIPHPCRRLCISEEGIALYDEHLLIVAPEDKSYDQCILDELSVEKVNSYSRCKMSNFKCSVCAYSINSLCVTSALFPIKSLHNIMSCLKDTSNSGRPSDTTSSQFLVY